MRTLGLCAVRPVSGFFLPYTKFASFRKEKEKTSDRKGDSNDVFLAIGQVTEGYKLVMCSYVKRSTRVGIMGICRSLFRA